jgi:hypothetical protein
VGQDEASLGAQPQLVRRRQLQPPADLGLEPQALIFGPLSAT